jgi:hypothetical protein
MSMTFGQSDRTSKYALCRGIWYFAVKAHHSIFRVESWLGQSVAYASVYAALHGMAEQKQEDLKIALHAGSGWHVITVSNNIQTFQKPLDHRIGQENKMIKGLTGTAVEMQDVDPDALNLEELK